MCIRDRYGCASFTPLIISFSVSLMNRLSSMATSLRGFQWWIYRLSSHFLPDFVNVHKYKPHTMAAPSPNNTTNASISCYFRILLASNAETMVVIEPNSMASHIVKLFISENSGKIRPIISPAKVSFDKSKNILRAYLVCFCLFLSAPCVPLDVRSSSP